LHLFQTETASRFSLPLAMVSNFDCAEGFQQANLRHILCSTASESVAGFLSGIPGSGGSRTNRSMQVNEIQPRM
jgi:hypothetical protein